MPLKPSMGIKAYIKDFQKSDAPQFKGHSKEKRRDQAIAAYLDAKDKLKEEKGRGPTGIAYSVPKGHPDAENPVTRKKYPERQTPEYKKKFFDKNKSSSSSFGMKESLNETKVIVGKHLDKAGIPYSYAGGPEPMVRQKDAAKAKALINKLHKDGTIKRNPGVTAYDKGPNIRPMSTALKKKLGIKENAFRPPHLSKLDVDHHKARELMSPAKHRDDGINRIMKGMKVSKAKATKMHDSVMKAYGFKPESVNEISVGLRNRYYDAAKRSHDTAANSAFAASLRKEPYDKYIDTTLRRKKGIKTAKDQAIKNIRGELYKKKTEAMDPMMLGKMQAQAAATQRANQKKRDEQEKKDMAKKATKEGAFYGRDDMVKAFKDDDKKRGMVRVRKQDGNMTHTVTVKRNSADHKKYEKKGYKMDPYFNEMTMGQGIMVKKVPAGDPAPQGFKLKKLAKMHGGKFDVYHKETEKVKDAKAGRTMYSDTTTEKLDHQDKPLVKKVVGMLKKASKAHAGQAKSLSKAMTDEAYIKSDKVFPNPQANLSKRQKDALGKAKAAKTTSTDFLNPNFASIAMAKKAQKAKDKKVGRGSEIVKYGRRSSNESKVEEKFSIKLPPVRGGKKILNVSMGRAIKMLKDFGATKSDMRNVLSGKGGRFQNAGGEMFLVQRESVNEVSMNRLGNYIKKRTADIASAGSLMTGDYGIGPAEKKAKRMKGVRDYSRFDRGVKKAVDKMTGKAKVPATNEGMNSYMASTRSMQGVVHARDEDHAREIMRTKHGAKGKIDLRLKGPVSKTTRERRPLGPMDRQESTWYMPTGKEVTILRNMMKRPIALGENAENAIDNIPIGSDTLHKIFVAEAKKDPNTDARTMVEKWLNDRLSHGDEEAEWLGIRLGILEGYEADVLKHLRKKGHEDPYFKGGHLMVSPNDHKSVVKTLKKKFGGMSPRGGSMMPSIKMDN